ncbi:MAG: hypothetical protein OJF49_004447 [Ktedonobacterales bacterium]|nr:MAG: hypothetical protein OJF49_004447 [Ktedonobacterales bacterium]
MGQIFLSATKQKSAESETAYEPHMVGPCGNLPLPPRRMAIYLG